MKLIRRKSLLIFTSLFLSLIGLNIALAGEKKDMGGWQMDSPYNRLYKPGELDAFKATVVKITEIVPMSGMSPGVAIHVKESAEDEVIVVHVCPTWYIQPGGIGLKRGDRVKVRGVWAEIDGKDVFLAAKIKKGDYFSLKVRLTKNGKPFWTMDQEELNNEKATVGSK